MEKKDRIELYKKAFSKWGVDAQTNMVYEECGELMSALARLGRGRSTKEDVLTELADVHIMIEQIATFLDYESFEKEKDRKLERLKERLGG